MPQPAGPQYNIQLCTGGALGRKRRRRRKEKKRKDWQQMLAQVSIFNKKKEKAQLCDMHEHCILLHTSHFYLPAYPSGGTSLSKTHQQFPSISRTGELPPVPHV